MRMMLLCAVLACMVNADSSLQFRDAWTEMVVPPSLTQVWYGVPADASETLEAAMHDALPHLFEATPSLLYQLVTMLSPKQLQVSRQQNLMLCVPSLS